MEAHYTRYSNNAYLLEKKMIDSVKTLLSFVHNLSHFSMIATYVPNNFTKCNNVDVQNDFFTLIKYDK